ncbi:MAG TPA: hypothetical protein PKD64_02780 [Pirellulaceae bacterium]|nr:hypothetical protein [Pirellulaceae bacterium]HMO91094.1 hypothetical protein [Pirellulaceae bacterium]HMP70558.1 hypothetical protein [Pirellulaceae bacterium]
MYERYTWTASLGRWLGVPIRLHVLFVLFGIVVFLVDQHIAYRPSWVGITAVATIVILLISVLLHELAHIFVNASLGGQVDALILAPWGGQSRLYVPSSPRAQLLVFLAGPFASLLLFAFGAFSLTQTGHATLAELTNPFRPFVMDTTAQEVSILKIATWVNFQLFVLNILMVHPFDGSLALRALLRVQNPQLSVLRVETIVLVIGVGTAMLVLALSWFYRDEWLGRLFPGWFLLSFLGITLISTARYGFHLHTLLESEEWEDEEDSFSGFNFFDDHDVQDIETDENQSISQWLQEKQESRESLEQAVEIEEEHRADRILEKWHRLGKDSLTDDERSLLYRVSARYRRKRRQTNS